MAHACLQNNNINFAILITVYSPSLFSQEKTPLLIGTNVGLVINHYMYTCMDSNLYSYTPTMQHTVARITLIQWLNSWMLYIHLHFYLHAGTSSDCTPLSCCWLRLVRQVEVWEIYYMQWNRSRKYILELSIIKLGNNQVGNDQTKFKKYNTKQKNEWRCWTTVNFPLNSKIGKIN